MSWWLITSPQRSQRLRRSERGDEEFAGADADRIAGQQTGVKKRGDAPYRFQGNEEDRLFEHFNLVGQQIGAEGALIRSIEQNRHHRLRPFALDVGDHAFAETDMPHALAGL